MNGTSKTRYYGGHSCNEIGHAFFTEAFCLDCVQGAREELLDIMSFKKVQRGTVLTIIQFP